MTQPAAKVAFLKLGAGTDDQPNLRITGDSTDPSHVGWFELASWTLETDTGGSGRLTFTKATGKSDLLLFNWFQNGWELSGATLQMPRSARSGTLTLTLVGVSVGKWSSSSTGAAMTINFEKVTYEYGQNGPPNLGQAIQDSYARGH